MREKRTHRTPARCAAGLLLLLSLLAARPLAAHPEPSIETSHAQADVVASPLHASIQAYSQGLAALRREASHDGQIRYVQVLEAVYSGDIDSLIAQKLKWQEQHAKRFPFFSDYSNSHSPVRISEFNAEPDRKLGSLLVGRYEAYSHTIEVSRDATDFVLVHESGHTLQRQTLIARNAKAIRLNRALEAMPQLHDFQATSPKARRDKQRLQYLTAQNELEVRLQDLNRLFALHNHGLPISNPIDSLQALALVGLELDLESATRALADTPWAERRQEIRQSLATSLSRDQRASLSRSFEDAAELRLLQTLLQRHQPKAWPHTLRKLLFEAPGHL
ncbi:hypothetical protein [Pelagicoccus sp. SDUM812005]|uniref:hypothetical protein n=1 Tax=Pelagicoccus sp. SDUM812005 TaxID=3041257 RepID=UPI00280D058E|nr:hypothetical protein [Pelagicoccus sp. SDUM812005]MDQ8180702.1 hypothetical protein [Pelagicoccus sp. SDUM812005]